MDAPAADRVLGLALAAAQRLPQSLIAGAGSPGRIEGAIDVGGGVAHEGAHRLELGIGEHRRFELQQPALALVLVEDVAEIAEPGAERHHPLLAQGIDGRVGDLTEILAEEVMERPVLLGEHGQRRVVAHRADRFLCLLDHRVEHQLQILHGDADGELAASQPLAVEQGRLASARFDDVVDDGDVPGPLAERALRRRASP